MLLLLSKCYVSTYVMLMLLFMSVVVTMCKCCWPCWKRTWKEVTLFQDSFLHTQALINVLPPVAITFQHSGGLSIVVVALHTYQSPTAITRLCVVIDSLTALRDQLGGIGSWKGGTVGLQPHLILRVPHRIKFFTIEIFFVAKSISPTWFDCLPLPLLGG